MTIISDALAKTSALNMDRLRRIQIERAEKKIRTHLDGQRASLGSDFGSHACGYLTACIHIGTEAQVQAARAVSREIAATESHRTEPHL